MSMRDHYRTRAAEFQARARNESDAMSRRQYESLARQYSGLAERVEHRVSPESFDEPRRHKIQNRQN
jgi:hypothetical protein